MKSYFIDELPSLKDEIIISNVQDCNINIENTITVKYKIKLLEPKNKLSKADVTNKQTLIDTILQHNSKISQNYDVSRISPVTHEARKQPPEKQHYEKKDTELNNWQKQEYEYKPSEKSNEKNESNKEITDHQKHKSYQKTQKAKVFNS